MKGMKRWRATGALLVLAAAAISPVNAAELKIFGSRVTKVIVGELGPQFEKATGYTPS
jgi:ABC-type molybdate transport system substrate-binding protein